MRLESFWRGLPARLVLCAFAACAARAQAEDVGLAEVLQGFTQRTHAHSNYVEQQFLQVLRRPLESRGELRYDAPDRLEKQALEPRAETLIAAGNVLTLQRGSHRHVLALADYPQIAPLILGMRATLAGDRATLERLFQVDFAGSLAHWMLELVPRDAATRRSVARIRIEGSGDDLSRIEIVQTNGDRSLMTLRPSPAP
jgi:hypothetical protein